MTTAHRCEIDNLVALLEPRLRIDGIFAEGVVPDGFCVASGDQTAQGNTRSLVIDIVGPKGCDGIQITVEQRLYSAPSRRARAKKRSRNREV